MDFHENPWTFIKTMISMGSHGFPWIGVKIHGNPSEIMGNSWKSFKCLRNRRKLKPEFERAPGGRLGAGRAHMVRQGRGMAEIRFLFLFLRKKKPDMFLYY